MVVDSSALLAIVFFEPEARRFTQLLQAARRTLLSAANFLEASILVESRRGSARRTLFDAFVEESGIDIEPVTRGQALIARDAYRRFGKGNHPARYARSGTGRAGIRPRNRIRSGRPLDLPPS